MVGTEGNCVRKVEEANESLSKIELFSLSFVVFKLLIGGYLTAVSLLAQQGLAH